MTFKTELHAHSAECSECGMFPADVVVENYIKEGYDTLVLSNHLKTYECGRLGGYEKCVDLLFEAYEKAKTAAAGRINVILAVEVGLNVPRNDYLLFGVTREFLEADPDLCDRTAEEVHERAKAAGMIFIQAHPFRTGCIPASPLHVDGYEVFNAQSDTEVNRELYSIWNEVRQDERMIDTSGSDYHGDYSSAIGGIYTEHPITTAEELLAVLKSGDYSIASR